MVLNPKDGYLFVGNNTIWSALQPLACLTARRQAFH